jgi:hypothetical protein
VLQALMSAAHSPFKAHFVGVWYGHPFSNLQLASSTAQAPLLHLKG